MKDIPPALLATALLAASTAGCLGAKDLEYVGILAKTTFGDAWNESAARAALEADAFNITSAGPRGLVTAARDDLAVTVLVPERPPWTFSVSYRADAAPAANSKEVQKLADADWAAFQPRFHDVVNDFEARVGWKHLPGASWEAVSRKA